MAGIWTQADIDNLKTAIASGVLTVHYDGPPRRSVTYQHLKDMREQLAIMVADVAGQNGAARRSRVATASKSKGFGGGYVGPGGGGNTNRPWWRWW